MGALSGVLRHGVRFLLILKFLNGILGQQDSACGDMPMVLRGYTGSFSSPNYPANYPSGTECSWRVISPVQGKRLWFVFNETYSIEEQTTCAYDSLKIYDGPDRTSPLKKTLCGKVAPAPIRLSGNKALLVFKSDEAVVNVGFGVTWRTCPPHFLQCDDGNTCVSPQKRCNMQQDCQDWKDELHCNSGRTCGTQINTTGSGNITSENYPVFFPPGLGCTWHIRAPPAKRLRARFTGLFDVPCSTPVIVTEIHPDGTAVEDAPSFCGSQTPQDIILTSKEKLKIDFHPQMVTPAGAGFALSWETICQENYFSCTEGTCIRLEKVCDSNVDCQQGEDESTATCSSTTTTTISSMVATYRPETQTTPIAETVTPQKFHHSTSQEDSISHKTASSAGTITSGKMYHTTSKENSIDRQTALSVATIQHGLLHTQHVWKTNPKASASTPPARKDGSVSGAWNGTLAGSTMSTSLSTAHSNKTIAPYPTHLCYKCHDDEACARPVDSTIPTIQCLDEEACWVERILGPGKEKERVVYRRGCGSACPDYFTQEDCQDGFLQICKLCCREDLCNHQLLRGDDIRFSNHVASKNVAEESSPNWVHLLVASLSAVSIFAA